MQSRLERRCIGLDVHRDFAQVAMWQGGVVTQAGRFATTPEGVRAFAQGLGPADEVALEVTGNTWAIATVLASRAGRVVVSNPAKTRAIAEAKVKTDPLTELSGQCGSWDVRGGAGVARLPRRDQRGGCSAGVVRAGGAADWVA
jgi:hypothetical protein